VHSSLKQICQLLVNGDFPPYSDSPIQAGEISFPIRKDTSESIRNYVMCGGANRKGWVINVFRRVRHSISHRLQVDFFPLVLGGDRGTKDDTWLECKTGVYALSVHGGMVGFSRFDHHHLQVQG
jgi:hypothetical protein